MRKKMLFYGCVCLLLGFSFNTLFQDVVSADQQDGYTYTVRDGTVTITDYSCAGTTISIPSTLGGYPTVAIGDNAFYACTFLTTVTIPDSITSIGQKAFKSCTSLTSIIIGKNVTTIGDDAFYYCSSLESIIIPDRVEIIGNGAFSYCSSLASVTLGDRVSTIGNDAFTYSGLISVTIPRSVSNFGDNAFSFCASLSAVTFEENLTAIGYNSFSHCPLTSVVIPDGLITIEGYAFYSCSSLTAVTMGKDVRTIGVYAFSSCSALTSISFLGLVAPSTVGNNWITNTPEELQGHAYAASNFPVPGGMVNFHGLEMGTVLTVENKAPVAGFTWSPSNLTVNQTVTFDASTSSDSDGSLVLYEWDWDSDGSYEESHLLPTVTHSWEQAGTYSVTVRVTDTGNATRTKTSSLTIDDAGGDSQTNTEKTPGFEFIFVVCALLGTIFLRKMKRSR